MILANVGGSGAVMAPKRAQLFAVAIALARSRPLGLCGRDGGFEPGAEGNDGPKKDEKTPEKADSLNYAEEWVASPIAIRAVTFASTR
jgi:hypothetical protein